MYLVRMVGKNLPLQEAYMTGAFGAFLRGGFCPGGLRKYVITSFAPVPKAKKLRLGSVNTAEPWFHQTARLRVPEFP